VSRKVWHADTWLGLEFFERREESLGLGPQLPRREGVARIRSSVSLPYRPMSAGPCHFSPRSTPGVLQSGPIVASGRRAEEWPRTRLQSDPQGRCQRRPWRQPEGRYSVFPSRPGRTPSDSSRAVMNWSHPD
jgi:hypothetical protein